MIKIATTECFTQGKIGRELHALAQSYEGNFGVEYIENPKKYGDFDYNDISVTCSLFIPTIEAVKKVLNVENPPKPKKLIKGIKVYDEKLQQPLMFMQIYVKRTAKNYSNAAKTELKKHWR